MNKLLQAKQSIECFFEMYVGSKNLKNLQSFEAFCNFCIGVLLFQIILIISVCIGDTHIPSYLGDGYSHDNFKRKEGEAPEYNYWLDCYIGNDGVILEKNNWRR